MLLTDHVLQPFGTQAVGKRTRWLRTVQRFIMLRSKKVSHGDNVGINLPSHSRISLLIDGSPVRRAMMNLHAALRLRVSRGDRTAELAHEVAAILDDAVRRIEKL